MKQRDAGMQRRSFLKKAAVGSIALTASGLLNHTQTSTVRAGGNQTNFHFMALSGSSPPHSMVMAGHGQITPSNVVGNGSFQHGGEPGTIFGEGSWKAKRLISFEPIGSYGIGVAAVLTMKVHLVPVGGTPIPAILEVVCNIPPGGLFTGKAEGYTLTIPGTPFEGNPFSPFDPPIGVTWFTKIVESAGSHRSSESQDESPDSLARLVERSGNTLYIPGLNR